MIADLDCDHSAWFNRFQLGREMLGALLNFRKCARDSPLGVKDGGAITVLCAGRFPHLENPVA